LVGDLEDELVVHGEQHVAPELRVRLEGAIYLDHRQLEHVGGAALDRGVQRLALPQLAEPSVVARELWDVPAAAEERLGVPVEPGALDLCRSGTT
jgi:hypothetical protein